MDNKKERLSEVMNLIGYGLAKFDLAFAKEFGFSTKTAFCDFVVDMGLVKTARAVFNRQDSFDPYFDNGRRGWFQRNQREHIKLFIDSLFGNEDVKGYANIVKMYIHDIDRNINLTPIKVSPVTVSRFKQLQETGKEAEFYFMNNYQSIPFFEHSILEDARLWGDGYDVQMQKDDYFFLVEIKGVREQSGSIRFTQKEFDKAAEFAEDFFLVVVSNLNNTPKLNCVQNPIRNIGLVCQEVHTVSKNYVTGSIKW